MDLGRRRTLGSPVALATLAVLVALATFLRVYALDSIPTPTADEGNWTWFGYDLFTGRPAPLAPDARFVSLAFARLIALSFRLFGVSFAAARAVCVAAVIFGMLVSYAACAAMRAERAGVCIALVLAVHPWSLLWSRTVDVPYALSLALSTAGPLVFLAALRARPGLLRTGTFFVAGQLLFAGVHFSPLAGVPIVACAAWALGRSEHRSVLRTAAPWCALGLGALHLIPVARGALSLVAHGTGTPRDFFSAFDLRLYTYVRTALDGLSGEATLRHFTGRTLSPVPEACALGAVTALLGLAARRLSASRASAANEMRAFGLAYLALGAVGLPVLLAPARAWNLPAVDAERYVFVLLAPFALVLGSLAEAPGRARRLAAVAFGVYLLVGPTARSIREFLAGGGPDRGAYLLRGGGGYRGWKVARERVALPRLIRREVAREAHGARATILVADYAFHPLHFVNVQGGFPTVDVFKFPMPRMPGERFFFVLWSDGMFVPGYFPAMDPDANAMLRRRMLSEFSDVGLVRRFVQPDGAPLIEVWTGVQRP